MMTVTEQKALRKFTDDIQSQCRESTAFASLCADACMGLAAFVAAVWLVCACIGGLPNV